MSREIEKLLKQMSLAQPSESLDRRCNDLLQKPTNNAHRMALRPPRRTHVVVAAICLLLGYLAGISSGGRTNINSTAERGDSLSRLSSMSESSASDSSVIEAAAVRSDDIYDPDARPAPLVDQGVYLLNGRRAVRTYSAVTKKRMQVHDPATGKTMEIEIPVRRTVIAPVSGT